MADGRHRSAVSVASASLVCVALLPLGAAALMSLTIEAPPALAAVAERVRAFDAASLDRALAAAGLAMPTDVHVTLVPESDPRARATPRWTVGLASGGRDVVIFPERVSVFPYDSVESVLRHELVHLALDRRAEGGVLPRWFHEGVAAAIGNDWGLGARWQLLRAAARGPTVSELEARFESGRQGETADAYRLAVALVDDVRRRHGAAIPGAIAARVAGGMPFDRAFALETGETPEQAAERAWSVYQRVSQWIPVMASGDVIWTGILLLAAAALAVQLRRRARQRRIWDELDEEG